MQTIQVVNTYQYALLGYTMYVLDIDWKQEVLYFFTHITEIRLQSLLGEEKNDRHWKNV